MKPTSTLGQIERLAWLRMQNDGLWDMGIGFLFLWLGLSIFAIAEGAPMFGPIGIAVEVPLFIAVKRWISEPRVGRVEFGPRRKRQLGAVTALLAGLALIGGTFMAIWVLPPEGVPLLQWIRGHFEAVIGLVWGGALAAAGAIVEVRRFILYGAVLCAALVGSDLAPGHNLGQALTASGGFMMLCGLALLFRFLRRYPRRPEGQPDVPHA